MSKTSGLKQRLRADFAKGAVWHIDFAPNKGVDRVYVQRIVNETTIAEPVYHRHDGLQICLIRYGSTEVEVSPRGPQAAQGEGVKRYPLAVGDGIVFPAGLWHRWAWADTGGVDVLAFTLTETSIPYFQDTLQALERRTILTRALERNVYAASIARRLDQEGLERKPGYEDAALALCMQFLVELARDRAPEDAEQGVAVSGSTVARARAYMSANFARPLLLEHIAVALDVSVSHLVRVFTLETGESPMRVLKKLRVEAARNLLVTTDSDLGKLAQETGLTNAQHLCKAFRAEFNETPKKYRQRMWRAGME